MRKLPLAGLRARRRQSVSLRGVPMRIRSARTLVFTREGGEIVAFNYLANSAFACSHDLLAFLALLDDWTPLEDVAALVPGVPAEELDTTIGALIGVHALTEEDSALAEAEGEFRQSWKWGIPAALFHFSVQDKPYVSLNEMED